MEVPLVIIHFRLGFSLINHPFRATPIDGTPHVCLWLVIPLNGWYGMVYGLGSTWIPETVFFFCCLFVCYCTGRSSICQHMITLDNICIALYLYIWLYIYVGLCRYGIYVIYIYIHRSRHKYPTCFDCLNAGGVRLNSLVYAYLFPKIS